MSWKPVKDENPNFPCRKCGSQDVNYRIVEDDDCHEDINYWCPTCGYSWWSEGCDS
jgi:DNA-directed RNA polymerase subunit M/transcription elongation factor TFIIS